MKTYWKRTSFLALLAVGLLQSTVFAGDKKIPLPAGGLANAELTQNDPKDKVRKDSYAKRYTFKMVEGRTYQIDMASKDFDSYLRLENSTGDEVAADDDGGGFPDARIKYKAPKSGDYTIICTSFGPNSTGKFTVTAKDADAKDEKPQPVKDVTVNGELTQADVKDKKRTTSYCKTYTYKMVEGRTMVIDMKSGAFDSYLRLENAGGEEVAFDDDGGGFPDARIMYRVPKTGDYTIICTTFGGGATGKFTLTVKDADGKQPDPIKDGKVEPQPVKGEAKAIALKPGNDKSAEFRGDLTNDDALYQNKKISKFFTYPMEAGKAYRIDMASRDMDAYLYLQDPTGKVVDQNDDNGESLDSRIIHKAEKSGDYRIVATSLGGRSTGAFTLTIKVASDAELKEVSLRSQIQKLFTGNATADERQQAVKAVAAHLEAKGGKITNADIGLAMGVTQALEMAKETKAAGEACTQFAKLVAKSDEPNAERFAGMFRGMAKRMTLIGNEMQIKGTTIDGKEFDLKNLKGKVVLVDFWATWCGPCVAEIPHMKAMHAKYHKDGFEIIGISLDFNEDALKKFMAKDPLPWTSIYEGDKKDGTSLADQYGVTSIPLPILVGRDGRVISMQARGPELTRLLEEAFASKK